MLTLTALATGLLAGSLHVVMGPDHLAAVAPLAAGRRRRAWLTGVMWGIAHSSGTWALAAIALLFRGAMDVDAVSTWSERVVGGVLIGIGAWGLHQAMRRGVHVHEHTHGGVTHSHAYSHGAGPRAEAEHAHGALGVGTLHGLAGASHLLGVLPALALPRATDAIVYVMAFGIGSIIAMAAFAAAVGVLAARADRLGARVAHGFMGVASVVAVGVGVYWLYIGMMPAHPA